MPTFTVIKSVRFDLERLPDEEDEDFQDRAAEHGARLIESENPSPIIHDCSDPDLIE